MHEWHVSDDTLHLVILVAAAVVVLALGRTWLKGRPFSYGTIAAGIVLAAVARVLNLAGPMGPGASPVWSALQLGLSAAGHLIILAGFIFWVYDSRQTETVTQSRLSEEASRARQACVEEAKLRGILNCATEYAIISWDAQGLVTSYSPGGVRILGWQPDEVVGRMNVAQFHAPPEKPDLAAVQRVVREKGFYEQEIRLVRKNGEVFEALLTVTELTGCDGGAEGYLGVAKDISALKRTQEALRRERDFMRAVIEMSELFIAGFSLDDRRLTLFNRGAERISGYERRAVIGRAALDLLLPPGQKEPIWNRFIQGTNGGDAGAAYGENPILTKGGEERILSWTSTLCYDDQERPTQVVVFGYDVTERAQMQAHLEQAKAELERVNRELERLATTDYLTELVNRRQAVHLFEHEIKRSRRQVTPIGVIMVDLDQFKAVNDSCGHEAGDTVLKHVAGLLRARLRASDIIARYGGEEFLVVLPECDLDSTVQVAENLRRRIRDYPAQYEQTQIPVRASLGVAALEPGQQELSANDVIRMADEALYGAKGLGGNRVVTWQMVREGGLEPSLATSEEAQNLQKRVSDLAKANNNTILDSLYRLIQSLEGRNTYTAFHSSRVARYAVAVAEEMELRQEQVDIIYRAAMLHDIGKVAVPDGVLWKNGALSAMDWGLVRQHPSVSVQILGKLSFLRRECSIIRHHHERPDGKGYPDGLRADAIPLEARVIAVADALDAMTRERPHRPALPLEEALRQLKEGAGIQFDTRITESTMKAAARADDWPLAESVPVAADAHAAN